MYEVDPKTGRFILGRNKQPELRLLDVGKECHAPCRNDRGCPKGTPEKPNTLNAANQQCYDHYRECRAVGQFPDDPVVKRNAAIIRGIMDEIDRAKQTDFIDAVIMIAAAGKV